MDFPYMLKISHILLVWFLALRWYYPLSNVVDLGHVLPIRNTSYHIYPHLTPYYTYPHRPNRDITQIIPLNAPFYPFLHHMYTHIRPLCYFLFRIFFIRRWDCICLRYAENITYINAVVIYRINHYWGLWVSTWGTGTGEHEALSII